MGCGSGTAPDAPRYELVPGPTLVTTLADRTDVVAGALVYDADGHPVPGVAVTFCATAGQLAPGEGLTNAVGAVGVAWSVPVASDPVGLGERRDFPPVVLPALPQPEVGLGRRVDAAVREADALGGGHMETVELAWWSLVTARTVGTLPRFVGLLTGCPGGFRCSPRCPPGSARPRGGRVGRGGCPRGR